MRPRILVIRGGAIGDFVLTLPAIKLLRDNFPSAHLELLGYSHILSLAEGRFYADAVRSIEYSAMAGFFVPGAKLAEDLVEYFSGFQQIISYLYDPDYFFETNLRRCGVKNYLSIPPILGSNQCAAYQLAQPLEQLALYLDNPRAEIFPSESDRQFALEFLGETSELIFAIHPGSGSPRKNWPPDHWNQLAHWLLGQNTGATLLLVGGEADEAEVRRLTSLVGSPRVRLACNLKLPHLAAILQRSSLFLGHDSGISHIAAAVKTRSILLFGPTDPGVWAPLGEHIRVLQSTNGELAGIQVSEMQTAISETGLW